MIEHWWNSGYCAKRFSNRCPLIILLLQGRPVKIGTIWVLDQEIQSYQKKGMQKFWKSCNSGENAWVKQESEQQTVSVGLTTCIELHRGWTIVSRTKNKSYSQYSKRKQSERGDRIWERVSILVTRDRRDSNYNENCVFLCSVLHANRWPLLHPTTIRFLGMTVRFVSPVMFPVISPDSDVTGVTSIASDPRGLI